MVAIDGVAPSKATIMSGEYRFVRPLYYATGPGTSKVAHDFVSFALSDEGQRLIAAQNVVNLKEGEGLDEIFSAQFGASYLASGVNH